VDRNLVLLNQNIARLRRDVRLQTSEIEQLIAADIDRASAARRLMRMQRAGWLERPVRRTSMSDCVRRSSQSEGGYPSIAFYGDDGFAFAQPILPAKHDNGQTWGRLDGRVPHIIFLIVLKSVRC
jgi:hypothetical protein